MVSAEIDTVGVRPVLAVATRPLAVDLDREAGAGGKTVGIKQGGGSGAVAIIRGGENLAGRIDGQVAGIGTLR